MMCWKNSSRFWKAKATMANANLNISVIEKRMLKQAEAADYTGLPVKHFKERAPLPLWGWHISREN